MNADPLANLASGDGLELYRVDLVDGGTLRAGVLVRSPTELMIVLTVDGGTPGAAGDTLTLGHAEADELRTSLAVAMARLRVLNHRVGTEWRAEMARGERLSLSLGAAGRRVWCVVVLLDDGSEFAFPAADIPRVAVALGAIEDRIAAVALAGTERPGGAALH